MRERSHTAAARPPRRALVSVDVVLLTPRGDELALLFARAGEPRSRARWAVPWELVRGTETLDDVARRVARGATGSEPSWLEQMGAFDGGKRHPGDADISIAYVGLVPALAEPPDDLAWHLASAIPALAPRQAAEAAAALETVRRRVDNAPIAFRLLPSVFTLSELQRMYEILLGRRLHKASFRRALQGAVLVEPLDEWRSEGRGRPAQLFRYAPRKRRGGRRAVRFDLLAGG